MSPSWKCLLCIFHIPRCWVKLNHVLHYTTLYIQWRTLLRDIPLFHNGTTFSLWVFLWMIISDGRLILGNVYGDCTVVVVWVHLNDHCKPLSCLIILCVCVICLFALRLVTGNMFMTVFVQIGYSWFKGSCLREKKRFYLLCLVVG